MAPRHKVVRVRTPSRDLPKDECVSECVFSPRTLSVHRIQFEISVNDALPSMLTSNSRSLTALYILYNTPFKYFSFFRIRILYGMLQMWHAKKRHNAAQCFNIVPCINTESCNKNTIRHFYMRESKPFGEVGGF